MFSGPFGDVSNLFAAAAANLPSGTLMNQASAAPASSSTTELSAAAADQLGLSVADPSYATVEAASAGIAELHKALDEIPISDKAAYVYAQQTKPELVKDEELFKFLMAEDFNVQVRREDFHSMIYDMLLVRLIKCRTYLIRRLQPGASFDTGMRDTDSLVKINSAFP